jgi:hypothetical protein
MSGGRFVNSSYPYYPVHQFADELESSIENNNKKDENGYCPSYNEETLAVLREKVKNIRKISEVMRAIDYLYSGDHDEESFLRAIKKIEDDHQ